MRRVLSWIFPYRTLTIETSLSPAEVHERLEKDVAPRRGTLRVFEVGLYNGRVDETGFDFRRSISGRNSFLPNVVGTIEPTPFGSRVHVHLKMPTVVTVFLAFWLGMVALMAIPFLFAMPFPFNVIPFGLLAFGTMLPKLGFNSEANLAERFLTDTLPLAEGGAIGAYR
ncbi:MAG: hypothetical protein RIF41_00980 [Polyangiaceae bacterium]